ncbi:hypothetical protein AQUCO_03600026v1 [Aquilegia coerulea]|uniref:Uncharacterized protein n=1 Tax=Aquilegia coerulea TaxID=218851 RepID=A0A2G5CUX6_AQUCA|nr:hypothetical protein AQUCO_03600026v1 [Aquilegia coerulea]
MVESERSHRSGRRRRRFITSELFLCFSSRSSSSSSSSMKISSKSILSPGRNREPSLSLSSSLSRRLRSNGSMKGGQSSPMFPTGSKKKGSSFEPPEPSSPKVTCIGQVRVKSKKKHGRKLRNRSQRRGEVSFRKTEQNQDGNGIHHQQQQQECLPHRNQRWVHLPLSICETLRAFGAEFNCFLPCGGRSSSSSCSWTSEREKVEKRRGSNGTARSSSSCGAVFARWLFALQENEEKGREIESVVMREEEKRVEREVVREIEMEISEEKLETKGKIEVEEEEIEEGRESICIPPKNALLLMRSRSAPFRMSSLANQFWESPAPQNIMEKLEHEEEDDEEEDELEVNRSISEERRHGVIEEEEGVKGREMVVKLEEETKDEEMVDKWGSAETFEEDTNQLKEEEIAESRIKVVEEEALENVEVRQEEEEEQQQQQVQEPKSSSDEGKLRIEEREKEFNLLEVEAEEEVKEVVEKRRVSFSTSSTMYFEPESETESEEEEEAAEAVVPLEETAVEKSTEEEVSEEEKEISTSRSSTEQHSKCQEGEDSKERETETSSLLPECLLLMMCEPKLSMEVSKETWVCSTDFVKFRPSEKKALQKNVGDESTKKKRLTSESNPARPTLVVQQPRPQQQKQTQIQPARSSYSKVEPVVAKSMATAVEKKLVNAGGVYEPFVLKRCKSEPMRNSAKLAPEVCFWKKNKLEPHPPPSLGVGATGIGF